MIAEIHISMRNENDKILFLKNKVEDKNKIYLIVETENIETLKVACTGASCTQSNLYMS